MKPSNDAGQTCFQPIRLVVKGHGHVPSMKNGKQLFFTNARTAKWMKAVITDLESQLLSWFRTNAPGTQTTQSARSWIATHLPLDDCLDSIGVPCGSWRRVKKGDEGAIIEITPL